MGMLLKAQIPVQNGVNPLVSDVQKWSHAQ